MVKKINTKTPTINLRDHLKITCKMAKKIKVTAKKITFDNQKLLKTIRLFKLDNKEKVKEIKNLFYNNIYMYLSLKQPISEKLKKPPIKLLEPILNEKNKLKLCIVTDNKTEDLDIKMLEYLSKQEQFKSYNLHNLIEIINFKEFSLLIKKTNDVKSLNFYYHQFIIENKFFGKTKKLLGKDLNNIDFVLFNNISKNFDHESKLIFSSINCCKLNQIYNNKLYKIKIASCSEKILSIYKSVKLNIYRVVANLLNRSEKYNRYDFI